MGVYSQHVGKLLTMQGADVIYMKNITEDVWTIDWDKTRRGKQGAPAQDTTAGNRLKGNSSVWLILEATGNKEQTDSGNILEIEPIGLGDALDIRHQEKIQDEEVEIEILCNSFGRMLFEKETKGNVQLSLLKI